MCMNGDLPLEVWACDNAEQIENSIDPYVSGITSDNIHAGKLLFKNNI